MLRWDNTCQIGVAASVAASLGSRLPFAFLCQWRTAYVADERPCPKQAGRALVAAIHVN